MTAVLLVGLVIFFLNSPTTAPSVVSPPPEQPVTTAAFPLAIQWEDDTSRLGGIGVSVTLSCPPGGKAFAVYGTDIYTADSSVCTAAVHDGLIDFENGGAVVVWMRPGKNSYVGTTANGVTSLGWGRGQASFFLEPASEISIALAFFDARNAYDVEAATATFTPDPHHHEQEDFITSVDVYPALFDWLRATGWQWIVDECHMKSSGDANTSCAYYVENAWTRAIGLAPVKGVIDFEIWSGGMRWVPDFKVHRTYFNQGVSPGEGTHNARMAEVWETVTDWIRANHPADVGAMISPDGSAPILDVGSIDLWRMYTTEFVEALE